MSPVILANWACVSVGVAVGISQIAHSVQSRQSFFIHLTLWSVKKTDFGGDYFAYGIRYGKRQNGVLMGNLWVPIGDTARI